MDRVIRYTEEGEEMRRSSLVPPKSPGLLGVSGTVVEEDSGKEDGTTDAVTLVVPGVDVKSGSHDAEGHGHEDKKGHGHGHGHSHDEVPESVAAVAMMVIMGDGLHNFTDGLAIGQSFVFFEFSTVLIYITFPYFSLIDILLTKIDK